MVRVWMLSRGPDGTTRLPQRGGVMDQAALMMDAFAVLDGADAAWRRDYPPAGTEN